METAKSSNVLLFSPSGSPNFHFSARNIIAKLTEVLNAGVVWKIAIFYQCLAFPLTQYKIKLHV